MIYQTYEKIPDLWTLYGLIELQTLCNYDRPCKKNIRSGGLCEIVKVEVSHNQQGHVQIVTPSKNGQIMVN